MRDQDDPPHEPRDGQADQPQRHPTIPSTSADEQRGHAKTRSSTTGHPARQRGGGHKEALRGTGYSASPCDERSLTRYPASAQADRFAFGNRSGRMLVANELVVDRHRPGYGEVAALGPLLQDWAEALGTYPQGT